MSGERPTIGPASDDGPLTRAEAHSAFEHGLRDELLHLVAHSPTTSIEELRERLMALAHVTRALAVQAGQHATEEVVAAEVGRALERLAMEIVAHAQRLHGTSH